MTPTNFPILPDWFNLDDYKATSSLDARGWLVQLTSRHNVINSYNSVSHIESTTTDEMVINTMMKIPHSQAETHLENLKSNGIFPNSEENTHAKTSRKLISPLTFRDDLDLDAYRNSETFKMDWDKAKDDLNEENESNVSSINQGSLLDIPLHEHLNLPDCIVYVDVFANREKVLNEFEDWLDSERDKIGMEGKYTSSDFRLWTKLGILPYLDLKIWSKLNKVTIPNSQMQKILYPGKSDVDLSERMKETKETADQLMTWDSMNILGSMCA